MAIMVYAPDGSFDAIVLVMVFVISGEVVVVGIGLTLYIVDGVIWVVGSVVCIVVGVIWVVGGEMVCCVDGNVEEVIGVLIVVGTDGIVVVVGLMVV